jgi:hypothetical protein
MRGTILSLLALLASGPAVSAADPVKTFPVSACRYTLPGKDWSWVTPVPPSIQAVCMARNEDGLILMLTILHVPPGMEIDEKFPTGFDASHAAEKGVQKRGGRLTTFKGLPCYEGEFLVHGEMTSVMRVVIANGFAYQLQLLGNADPVEKRPDFEAIMNGFEFTSPPVPPDPHARAKARGHLLGNVVVQFLFTAIAVGLLFRWYRNK